MNRALVGVLAVAGLLMVACWSFSAPEKVFAQHGLRQTDNGGLIALSAQLPNGHQQLTVVDPAQRVIAVYHVDPTSGELSLRSVRNIQWDLRMTQFNGSTPLPQEIRTLLQQN